MDKQSFKDLSVKSKNAAQLFRAFNHKLRQQMLLYPIDHPDTDVGKIYKKFRLDQSTTSLHLGILRKANLVHAKRQGQRILYSVNMKQLETIGRTADQLLRTAPPQTIWRA